MSCAADVLLGLRGEGSDGSTTIVDSTGNHSPTAVGNAQIDTAQFKFGAASILFDGSGDYISVPDSANWILGGGTGGFAIGFWIRFKTAVASGGFCAQRSSGDDNWVFEMSSITNVKLRRTAGGSGVLDLNWSWSPSIDTWYYVELNRGWGGNANDFSVSIDGTSLGTQTSATTFVDLGQVLAIGANGSIADDGINAWVDDFFITNATRHTANFTAPSTELCVAATSTMPVVGRRGFRSVGRGVMNCKGILVEKAARAARRAGETFERAKNGLWVPKGAMAW
jgi:hypothetical protein